MGARRDAGPGRRGDAFGASVALGPDPRVAVGAPGAGTGAVYVFRRLPEGAWVQEERFQAAGIGTEVAFNDVYVASGSSTVRTWRLEGATWVPRCTFSNADAPSLSITAPHIVYSNSSLVSIRDLTTCTLVRSFPEWSSDVATDEDQLVYVRNTGINSIDELRYRPSLAGTEVQTILDPAVYGGIGLVSVRREYIAAASLRSDLTPELFLLRKDGDGGWGVFRRSYPSTQQPSALGVSGRYAVVGATNGSTGRAFLIDLQEVLFFERPVALAPADDATGLGAPLGFAWSRVEGAQSYTLEVDNNPNFNTPIVEETGLVDTTFVVESGLGSAQTYYWRVRAERVGQVSHWTAVRQFETAVTNTAPAPALTSPANNAVNVPLSTTLRWNAAVTADSYQVQVARDADFSTLVEDQTTTALQQAVSGLLNGRRYFWRVRSLNAVGEGPWSLVRDFTTLPREPVVPVPILPADAAEDVARTPLFAWGSPSQLAVYTLQVSQTADFSTFALNVNLTDTTYQATAPLQASRLHYWRVRAANGAATTAWSPVRTFLTGVTVGAEDGTPAALALSDASPNPSAGTVAFRLDVPAPTAVRLAVYDALGREVAVLLDGESAAGTHTPTFDASRLAPGLYVARLTAGAATETRRFTVAR